MFVFHGIRGALTESPACMTEISDLKRQALSVVCREIPIVKTICGIFVKRRESEGQNVHPLAPLSSTDRIASGQKALAAAPSATLYARVGLVPSHDDARAAMFPQNARSTT